MDIANTITNFLNDIPLKERRAPSRLFNQWYTNFFMPLREELFNMEKFEILDKKLEFFLKDTIGDQESFESLFKVKLKHWTPIYNPQDDYHLSKEELKRKQEYLMAYCDLSQLESEQVLKAFYLSKNRDFQKLKLLIQGYAPNKACQILDNSMKKVA